MPCCAPFRGCFQQAHIGFKRRGKRMVHRSVPFLLVVPFDERKIRDPDKIEFIRIDQSQLLPQANQQIPEGIVYDFTLVGHEEDDVSGFYPETPLQRLLHVLLQELGYRRLPAVRLNLDPGLSLGRREPRLTCSSAIPPGFPREVPGGDGSAGEVPA